MLALTMGDPAGIAPEITRLAWQGLRETGPRFVVLADPALLVRSGPVRVVDAPDTGGFTDALPVLPCHLAAPVIVGTPDIANAPAIAGSILAAVRLAQSGAVRGIVTNPITKNTLAACGIQHNGHTGYIAELLGSAGKEVMMLASPMLRVVPVTVHVALARAVAMLSSDAILHQARITHRALIQDFGIAAPRLAIAGVNPHAGEDGMMGDEEARIISPAIAALRAEGIDARGPFSPDTLFITNNLQKYDAAICMYHDQALIPIKTLDMAGGVNVTLGLPIVRTSPDHGTAFDIAGKGLADPSSLIAALRLADRIATNRGLS
jgi:4-hydroxythreonine-4-phosphate dehydrogenase